MSDDPSLPTTLLAVAPFGATVAVIPLPSIVVAVKPEPVKQDWPDALESEYTVEGSGLTVPPASTTTQLKNITVVPPEPLSQATLYA
jgi:hypothetical protein